MPKEHERPGMFAPCNAQQPRDRAPIKRSRPATLQLQPQQPQLTTRYQGGYRAYVPPSEVEFPPRSSTVPPGNEQSIRKTRQPHIVQRTTSQQFKTTKKTWRSSQTINGVMYMGSVGPEHMDTSSPHLPRNTQLGRDGHQRSASTGPPSTQRHVAPQSSDAPQQYNHRSHPRQHFPDKPLPRPPPIRVVPPPGEEAWRVTNPDPPSPNTVPLCPLKHRTGKPEHRELCYGDEHPDSLQQEGACPPFTYYQTTEAYPVLLTGDHHLMRKTDGNRISFNQGTESEHGPALEESSTRQVNARKQHKSPAVPATALASTGAKPGVVAASTAQSAYLEATDHKQRPIAKISDEFQAKRGWKFAHEEEQGNKSPYPNKTVLGHAGSGTGIHVADSTAASRDTTTIPRGSGSFLDLAITHLIGRKLELEVPVASTVAEYGVGGELVRESSDKMVDDQWERRWGRRAD